MRVNSKQFICSTCCLLAAFLWSTKVEAQAPPASTNVQKGKTMFANWQLIVGRSDSLLRTDTLKNLLPDSLLQGELAKKGKHYLEGIAKPVGAEIDRKENSFRNDLMGRTLEKGRTNVNAYAARVGTLGTQLDSLRQLGRVSPDSLLSNYGTLYGNQFEEELADHLRLNELPGNGPDAYSDLLRNELSNGELSLPAEINVQPALDVKKLQGDHFPDPSMIQPAMEKLRALKDKYRVLSDSRHQKETQNRKSLKGRSLLQRMEAGIGMHVSAYRPFTGEISITAGYRFNTDWRAGAGILLPAPALTDRAPVGYRAYTLYRLVGGLLLHGAYEHRSRSVEAARRASNHLLLAGVSYEVSLYRGLRLRNTALYHLNHKEASRIGLSSPWQTGAGLVFYY